jgi:hypothetical protein
VGFENIINNRYRRRKLRKKTFKVLLAACIFIVSTFLVLLAISGFLAFTYHAEIYDGFMRIISYIFGDSPDNVLRGFMQQFADSFLKNLVSGD